MPVKEYLDKKKEAKKLEDTIKSYIRFSFDDAIREELYDPKEGLVWDKLNDDTKRDSVTKKIRENLETYVNSFFEANPKGELKKSLLASGCLGFTSEQIKLIIDTKKGDFNFDMYDRFTTEAFKPIEEKIATILSGYLSEKDRDEVIKYTGINKKLLKDKLTVPIMAQMLDLYEQLGVVPPKWLKQQGLYKN